MSEQKPYDFLKGVIVPFWTPVDASGQLDLQGHGEWWTIWRTPAR